MTRDASEVFDTDVDISDALGPQPNLSRFQDKELGTVAVAGSSDDLFARREGKTLTWKNVNMTLAASGDQPERKLLANVWGEVPKHTTTAIMGPSGAGKTSLLNILAGRASSHGRVTIDADLRLNNYTVDPTNMEVRKQIAFVAQDDSLQVTSTPREAIRFSAKLRLSRDTTEEALDQLTNRMLTELGLTSCADTMVGGDLIKGISGGERKRTSVGVELVVKPALVFLDEPTSGLDSYSAVQLCQVLRKVSNAGASVLFTIHQPSSEIFSSFDNLILMNKGMVMYYGQVCDVPDYFEARRSPVPPHYNPADWIMNVAQSVPVEELDDLGFFPSDRRKMGDAFTPEEGQDALGITKRSRTEHSSHTKGPPGMLVQTSLLFQREVQNLQRDVAALVARFGLTIFMSLLIGVIFLDVGATDKTVASNIQSHFGAAIMVLVMSMFGTGQTALFAFPSERPVFLREFSTNHYSVLSYFISRLSMEALITAAQILVMLVVLYWLIQFQGGFVIIWTTVYSLAMASTALAVLLGCAVEDAKLGQEMLPLLFVPQMLFAGFFVTPALIPAWLRWARYLCTLTYAVRIIMVAEFGDCADRDPNSGCAKVLSDIEADKDGIWWNWLMLLVLFGVFRVGAVMLLRTRATKFY